MAIDVAEEPMTALSEYARVPIIFIVDYVLDVTNRDDGLRGFTLSERPGTRTYRVNSVGFSQTSQLGPERVTSSQNRRDAHAQR
jgi:hypothetical protein